MADSELTGYAHILSAGFHLNPASFILSMTAWLGLSSGRPSPNLIAIWRSCLLSKRRTPARLSWAMPKGSAGATHFFCPTLLANDWSSGLAWAVRGLGGSRYLAV